jgi:hypothetical protein
MRHKYFAVPPPLAASASYRSNGRMGLRLLRTGIASIVSSCLLTAPTPAAEPLLLGYQRPDGAITVLLPGDVVVPYFAAKALISADAAHADVRSAALKWIEWLMPRQNADGTFDRFCERNGNIASCAHADADDSALALWIELLARYSPSPKMPPNWQSSLDKSTTYLARLYDPKTGVYQISSTLHVALLMDNVEVHDAMRTLSAYRARIGDARGAGKWRSQADRLSSAIVKVFWSSGKYEPSTQHLADQSFYPTAVAQIFPILSDIGVPGHTSAAFYGTWMKQNCQAWLDLPAHDYPWGLVALASQKFGDKAAVSCWHAHSAPFRHGAHWNVLEEALFTSFEAQLSDPLAPAQCCMPFST